MLQDIAMIATRPLIMLLNALKCMFSVKIFVGRYVSRTPGNALVLFPLSNTLFCCGLAGIVSFHKQKNVPGPAKGNTPADILQTDNIRDLIEFTLKQNFDACQKDPLSFFRHYLGGENGVDALDEAVRKLKAPSTFYRLYTGETLQQNLGFFNKRITAAIREESTLLSENMGVLDPATVRVMSDRIEQLKDIAWAIQWEILENVKKIKDLGSHHPSSPTLSAITILKKINTVLNSIDRLEVRGRDSAGISLLFWLNKENFRKFKEDLVSRGRGDLFQLYQNRMKQDVLLNRSISVHDMGNDLAAISLVYKYASEVGRLGDNVHYLRNEIKTDPVLHLLLQHPIFHDSVSAHTRWASIGAINEPNCHPVDNRSCQTEEDPSGIIHVCLNGDIDNYLELKEKFEKFGRTIHPDITTDTKIIPLYIDHYLREGLDVEEAFRRTVNLFEGSHAISMHTDLAPGRLFLAQKGSGQTIFIGLASDFYMPASEVYGFVEETPFFCKMNGKARGQIFILDQNSPGGIEGIDALYYDSTPIRLTEDDIQHTRITSRDIDRQGFDHYFLKEISESPASVEKTLENRWKMGKGGDPHYRVELDEKTMPPSIRQALEENRIRRIFFVGQGTAGVAAKACADILNFYVNDPTLLITALKASELSGFKINDTAGGKAFADSLVIAISQSGTTTDTNRTVDMVKERGAHTLAIVNRRDSDITFKVDGVMYTSSGRDIEMSVASTKAFYSQIVAGALLGLYIAVIKNARSSAFVTDEIRQLLALPEKMRKVLAGKDVIAASARRTATTRNYWAVVGSGPNKASADEIRIKLSELCYKTISSDYVEDKKHIDLSSEPLIIICAAGVRQSVIGDIIKDTAIFQAHKATPIVIADEGEHRFDPYAADVFHVPSAGEHLSPILSTLAGHLWGYYAALSINDGSAFFHGFREDIRRFIMDQAEKGQDVYELILDKTFREKIAAFYQEFRKQKARGRIPAALGLESASDLTLLLKYLSGRLPVSDFELDFSQKGTASNMLDKLFECLGQCINSLSRPVDAIRHQAKTVTVGTSRIREKLEGLLFETLSINHLEVSQVTNSNVMVLKNLQGIVETINGTILYKIQGLNLLGEPTDQTSIYVESKTGILSSIPSRVEKDASLKGTKRIIVRQGNVYIGKGRKDDRSILIIPLISKDPERPNIIEHLLLLNISFRRDVPTATKIKALGGKYEHVKSIVQENSVIWDDTFLDRIEIDELFGRSAEKIGELIVSLAESSG